MAKTEYTTLNLPKTQVEELKVWRMAFYAAYGKQVSYSEMLRGMLDSLENSDPGVVEELNRLVKKHPDLLTIPLAVSCLKPVPAPARQMGTITYLFIAQ